MIESTCFPCTINEQIPRNWFYAVRNKVVGVLLDRCHVASRLNLLGLNRADSVLPCASPDGGVEDDFGVLHGGSVWRIRFENGQSLSSINWQIVRAAGMHSCIRPPTPLHNTLHAAAGAVHLLRRLPVFWHKVVAGQSQDSIRTAAHHDNSQWSVSRW